MQRSLIQKVEPEDVMAGLVIVGCIVLMALRADGIARSVLITVVSFYWGKKSRSKSKKQ